MDITDHKILILGAYSLVLGVLLGVCWGVLSFVRIIVTPRNPTTVRARAMHDLITFFFDIFYALFAAVCTVFLFFGANNGRIRLLGIAGCAVGFSLYHYTVGKRLIEYFSRFVGAVRRALRFVWHHTVGVPVQFVCAFAGKRISDVRARRAQRRAARARAGRKRDFTV